MARTKKCCLRRRGREGGDGEGGDEAAKEGGEGDGIQFDVEVEPRICREWCDLHWRSRLIGWWERPAEGMIEAIELNKRDVIFFHLEEVGFRPVGFTVRCYLVESQASGSSIIPHRISKQHVV